MNNILTSNLKKALRIAIHPELLKTVNSGLDRDTVVTLLDLKKQSAFEPLTILDIGAAIGTWTRAAALVFPNAHIHAFEPIPENHARLEMLHPSVKYLETYQIALSNTSGTVDFNLNEFVYSSSLLPMTDRHKELYPFTKNEQTVKVVSKRLDEVENLEIRKPALLKIDVQGAELMVLEGCGDLLSLFDTVYLELSFEQFYDRQASIPDVFHFMFDHGFTRFLQVHPHYLNNKLVYCDLIFQR